MIALSSHLVVTTKEAANNVLTGDDRRVPNADLSTQQDSPSSDRTAALMSREGLMNNGAEYVPVDVNRSAQTPSRSRASSVALSKIKPAVTFNVLPLSRSAPDRFAAQIDGNRPPTPEGSAERDPKSQVVPGESPPVVPQASSDFEAILISDDEDESLALTVPRCAIDPTLTVQNSIREEVVDLTQLSSSPRDKKRKFFRPLHLSDSENDSAAETDGSKWRRKSRGRWK